MVFSEVTFVFLFLPLFLAIYYGSAISYRNLVLIFASLLFYVWGEGVGVCILFGLCCINYFFGKKVTLSDKNKSKQKLIHNSSKAWLIFGVVINLSILFYFKYMAWIVNELTAFVGTGGSKGTRFATGNKFFCISCDKLPC